jgi:hypothetical protein
VAWNCAFKCIIAQSASSAWLQLVAARITQLRITQLQFLSFSCCVDHIRGAHMDDIMMMDEEVEDGNDVSGDEPLLRVESVLAWATWSHRTCTRYLSRVMCWLMGMCR